jgi:hypothetical protein
MAKLIKQYRYYNDSDSSRNYPSNISYARLTSGSIFFSDTQLGAITQLGIQALPGTKFYLNNSADPIIIGSTGIYELDLEGVAEISALSFDSKSIDSIKDTNSAYLIVDAIYDVEE